MPVLGTYTATANTPIGKRTLEISILENGNSYKGILRSETYVYELAEVKVSDNKFVFDVKLNLPIGSVSATFNCSVHDNTLIGEIVTPYATVNFQGQRA